MGDGKTVDVKIFSLDNFLPLNKFSELVGDKIARAKFLDSVKFAWAIEHITKIFSPYRSTLQSDFRVLQCNQQSLLARGALIFGLSKYGSLCAAARVEKVRKVKVSQAIKGGPEVLDSPDCFVATADGAAQLMVLGFWCEPGYGRAFMEYLRDMFMPEHESIIYFRTKKGKRIAKMLTRNDATNFMRIKNPMATESADAPFLATTAARDFYWPTLQTQLSISRWCGDLARLLVSSPSVVASPVKPVVERLQTFARLQQHRFYESATGERTGLLTWGWLTLARLQAECFDVNGLQAFEWSEGEHLAIVDVVPSAETHDAIWADLAGQLYPAEAIWLLCEQGDRTFFKKWTKDQRIELSNKPARTQVLAGQWAVAS